MFVVVCYLQLTLTNDSNEPQNKECLTAVYLCLSVPACLVFLTAGRGPVHNNRCSFESISLYERRLMTFSFPSAFWWNFDSESDRAFDEAGRLLMILQTPTRCCVCDSCAICGLFYCVIVV